MQKTKLGTAGLSVVEAVIALAIISIGSLAFMTMMNTQQGETRAITEKLASLEASRNVLVALTDSTCSFLLVDASQSETAQPPNRNKSTFDSTSTSDRITFQKIPATASALGASHPVISTGQPASPLSNSVVVQSIEMTSFTNVSPDLYTAALQINFDSSKLFRSLKPLIYTTWIATNPASPPTAKTITACTMTAPTAGASNIKGFCTPHVDWDNSNTLVCQNLPGYHPPTRLTGVGGGYRNSACCYVPLTTGSNGWCSTAMQGWNSSFSGCGTSTSEYAVNHVYGVVAGSADTHVCCFIPLTAHVGPTDIFSTAVIGANDGHVGCGGPYTYYSVIKQNVVTANQGNHLSCTFVSK